MRGDALGECMFYGAGAGKRPTASAVVADVIDAAKHKKARKYLDWEDGFEGYVSKLDTMVSRWYIRTGSSLKIIGETFGNLRLISFPGEYPGAGPEEYAFATAPMDGSSLKALIKDMDIRSLLRILD